MKKFGSIRELVSTVFSKDSQQVTLRPNQSVTYNSTTDIQLAPSTASTQVLVSEEASQTLFNKSLSGANNTLSNISITDVVTQNAHGFIVGDVLYLNGSVYTKAIATSADASEVVGIVSRVIDVNQFEIIMAGELSGLTQSNFQGFTFAQNSGVGFDGAVSHMAAQSDGKIIVGGSFTSYNETARNRIIRLNVSGTIDTSFTVGSGFDDVVRRIAIQSDGKIVVGGSFTTLNGVTRNHLVRLNSDGTEDTDFYTNLGTGFNSTISALAIQSDGKILAGGSFTTLNGVTRNYLVRLNSDGTEDTDFYTNLGTGFGFGIAVNTVAIQSDGKILAGGNFSRLNGVNRRSLVRLNSDGTEDTAFYTNMGAGFSAPGANTVNIVAIQSDGKILAGGNFTTLNGVTRNRLVRLNSDGTEDTDFYTNLGTGFGSTVNTVAIQSDGKILAGGNFTTLNGVTRNRLVRLNSDGTVDNDLFNSIPPTGSRLFLSQLTAGLITSTEPSTNGQVSMPLGIISESTKMYVDLKSKQTIGALAIAKGGTGQTTATDALNALLPAQSGQSGKVLQTNGTNPSWAAAKTYTYIVAPSGGDFSTIWQAVGALGGAPGSIFIKNGTYIENSITYMYAGLVITGESKTGVVIKRNSGSRLFEYFSTSPVLRYSRLTADASAWDSAAGDGTVSVTRGSNTVTTSTSTITGTESGYIIIDGASYNISSTTAPNTITLATQYSGETTTDLPYQIRQGSSTQSALLENVTLLFDLNDSAILLNCENSAGLYVRNVNFSSTGFDSFSSVIRLRSCYNCFFENIEIQDPSNDVNFGTSGISIDSNYLCNINNVAINRTSYAVRGGTSLTRFPNYLCDFKFSKISNTQNTSVAFFGHSLFRSNLEIQSIMQPGQNAALNSNPEAINFCTIKIDRILTTTASAFSVENSNQRGNIISLGHVPNGTVSVNTTDTSNGAFRHQLLTGIIGGTLNANESFVGNVSYSVLGGTPIKNNGYDF